MHENIKNQIKDAMRAKDTIRLEVLRGLQALFSNELIAISYLSGSASPTISNGFDLE